MLIIYSSKENTGVMLKNYKKEPEDFSTMMQINTLWEEC